MKLINHYSRQRLEGGPKLINYGDFTITNAVFGMPTYVESIFDRLALGSFGIGDGKQPMDKGIIKAVVRKVAVEDKVTKSSKKAWKAKCTSLVPVRLSPVFTSHGGTVSELFFSTGHFKLNRIFI